MKVAKHITNKKSIHTAKSIEKRLHAVHNNKYSYFFSVYITSKDTIDIACPIHGLFKQSVDKHLQGRSCPRCANKARGDCKRSNTAEFISKALKIHNGVYSYNNTIYGNIANDSVTITCSVHGDFKQCANSHLAGHGCDKCAELIRRRNYLNEPTILYYLFFPNKNLYKIGITVERRGIKHRYCADTEPYEVVHQHTFSTGELAYNVEQAILKNNKQYKYNGEDILVGGNSELFTHDILKDNYDKMEQYLENEGNR